MSPNGPMPESRWRLLYPCHTCGTMPRVTTSGHEPSAWLVECPNTMCPERPVAVEETEEAASKAWNAHQRRERRVATDDAPDSMTEYAQRFRDWRVSQGRLA